MAPFIQVLGFGDYPPLAAPGILSRIEELSKDSGGNLGLRVLIVDDERRTNTFGLLMSLNMLIENGDGFDYSHEDFGEWAHAAGFKRAEVISLTGPTSAAVAYK